MQVGHFQDILTTGIQKYPKEKDAHYNIAMAFYWLQEVEKARDEFKKEMLINSKNARAHYMYGYVSFRLGDFKTADREMNIAYKLDPRSELITSGYNGLLTLRAGSISNSKPKEAIQYLEKAITLSTTSLKTYELLSYLYAQNKEYSKSVKACEQLVLLKPEIAIYHNNLANALNYEGKDYTRAKEEAQKAIEINLQMRYSFLDSFGWAEYHLGNYVQAQDSLEEVLNDLPAAGLSNDEVCSIYYHLGEVWIKQGNPLLAKTYFQKALDLKVKSIESDLAKSALKKIKIK